MSTSTIGNTAIVELDNSPAPPGGKLTMNETSTTTNHAALYFLNMKCIALIGLLFIAMPTWAIDCVSVQVGDSMTFAKSNPLSCKNRKGEGHGLFEYRLLDGTISTGRLKNGFPDGQWFFKFGYGATEQAYYANGKRHGVWIYQSNDEKNICFRKHYDYGELTDTQKCD